RQCRIYRICRDVLHHGSHRVFGHLLARDGRIRFSDPGKKKFEVVIYLRGGPYSRARVARDYFLFDGYSRCNTFDVVYLGLVHPTKGSPHSAAALRHRGYQKPTTTSPNPTTLLLPPVCFWGY